MATFLSSLPSEQQLLDVADTEPVHAPTIDMDMDEHLQQLFVDIDDIKPQDAVDEQEGDDSDGEATSVTS